VLKVKGKLKVVVNFGSRRWERSENSLKSSAGTIQKKMESNFHDLKSRQRV
jgi:hypothetical protein